MIAMPARGSASCCDVAVLAVPVRFEQQRGQRRAQASTN